MAVAPDTQVDLLYVAGIDSTQKDQLYFSDKSSRNTYMKGKIKHSYTDFSYQRKDGIIRVPTHVDSLWDCNYVRYQNTHYGTRWFFAFIEKMEYVNDNCTAIYIKTDVFQTWYYDCTLLQCFVQREHVANDTIGRHVLDEGVETGEIKLYSVQNPTVVTNWVMGLMTTEDPFMSETDESYFPIRWYGTNNADINTVTSEGFTSIALAIKNLTARNKADAIRGVYLLPRNSYTSTSNGAVQEFTDTKSTDHSFPINRTTLDGYTPKNNKMWTYPYYFSKIVNFAGGELIIRHERCNNNTIYYRVYYPFGLGKKLHLFVQNYNQNLAVPIDMHIYHLSSPTYPETPWAVDSFSAWLSANAASLSMQALTGGITAVTGIAAGNPLTAIAGATNIANVGAQAIQQSTAPTIANGSTAVDILAQIGRFGFQLQHYGITSRAAERIDNFFTMYGYRVDMVKKPTIHSRESFTYVKTIDCKLAGDIPTNDMAELKAIFNNGCTFWVAGKTVGDYTQANGTL